MNLSEWSISYKVHEIRNQSKPFYQVLMHLKNAINFRSVGISCCDREYVEISGGVICSTTVKGNKQLPNNASRLVTKLITTQHDYIEHLHNATKLFLLIFIFREGFDFSCVHKCNSEVATASMQHSRGVARWKRHTHTHTYMAVCVYMCSVHTHIHKHNVCAR